MAEISEATKNLISRYEAWQSSLQPKEGVPTIHVDEIAMRVAVFYEQIRTIVDWKEEHLMKRAAIIRKLKRRFLDSQMSDFSAKDMGEALVLELIRGGYFPNDKVEESKVTDVQKVIDKYIFILKENRLVQPQKTWMNTYHRLLEIAACEIEEALTPSIKEMALVEYMFGKMKERIKVNERVYQRNILKREDKDIQIYIALQQALFKFDDPIISYNLIRYKHPGWDNPTPQDLLRFAHDIYQVLEAIEKDLTHPLGKKFYKICEKYDTAYLIVGDILLASNSSNGEKKIKQIYDPVILEGLIKEAYAKRLKNLREKTTRAAAYSTASIFITKILSLLVLETIFARLFGEKLSLLTLIADIAIPTGLMALLVATVKPPSKNNINLVVAEVLKIYYHSETADIYEIKAARKKGVITKLFLSFTYVMGAFISFGAIYWVLDYVNFPLTSIIINMVFIALILFAGTAVQKRSQELTIEEESGGFLLFLSDILFLPVAGLGRWLSNTWRQYNAITAFFNALIDMPFSVFIEFLERWRGFIKERKEDLR